jgi:hypothetical protein
LYLHHSCLNHALHSTLGLSTMSRRNGQVRALGVNIREAQEN